MTTKLLDVFSFKLIRLLAMSKGNCHVLDLNKGLPFLGLCIIKCSGYASVYVSAHYQYAVKIGLVKR